MIQVSRKENAVYIEAAVWREKMQIIDAIEKIILLFCMIVLSLAIVFSLIRAVLGPRVTDRIIAVNLIGTKTIISICVLAIYLKERSLIDVAIVYALMSFLAVVVLVNIYISAYNKKKEMDAARMAEQIAEELKAAEAAEAAGKEEDRTEGNIIPIPETNGIDGVK